MSHNTLGWCFLKIKEDKQHAKDMQAAQEVNLQCGIDHIASIEAAMEAEQGIQVTAKVKPIKSCARPVKKKIDRDAGDVGEEDAEAVRNEVAKLNKIKKVHVAIGATTLGSDQRGKGTGTDKKGNPLLKKFGLTGKVNNWCTHMEPETKSKVSPITRPKTKDGSVVSATTLKTSQTAATMVSLAKNPLLSLTDLSDDSVSDNGEDRGNEEDRDGDDEDFKEQPSINVKGKVGMKIAEGSGDRLSDVPISMPFNLLLFSQQADIARFALEQA
ncbi:uncharacterized protein EDB93DRAFT_1103307 [Suillus bovinus]|uniref:uncharacterized protein n=1 Tax=Suillus bovinus TaxID=48563 RepID=UPI001B880939|nr:uncharacterized protein EDB93DRAFT_1103307 [Suillus bovinus]KAG2151098.1 hypothetical protein EDB93DRAFT_1103307 [Suillus bovinus]